MFEDEILVLTDEDGCEHEFLEVERFSVGPSVYAVLVPLEEGEEEALILRVEGSETGEEVYCEIEDEEEWQTVAQAWEEMVEGDEYVEELAEDEEEDDQ